MEEIELEGHDPTRYSVSGLIKGWAYPITLRQVKARFGYQELDFVKFDKHRKPYLDHDFPPKGQLLATLSLPVRVEMMPGYYGFRGEIRRPRLDVFSARALLFGDDRWIGSESFLALIVDQFEKWKSDPVTDWAHPKLLGFAIYEFDVSVHVARRR